MPSNSTRDLSVSTPFTSVSALVADGRVVRQRIDRVTLIVVSKEDTHQFARAAIALQPNADSRKHRMTAEIGQHPCRAAILFMHRILIRNRPYVLAEVLHIAELDMRRILDIYLDHAAEQRRLLALKSRIVFLDIAHTAQFFGDNQRMREEWPRRARSTQICVRMGSSISTPFGI